MTQGEERGVRAQVKAYNATGKRQSTYGKRERPQVKGQIARRKGIRHSARYKGSKTSRKSIRLETMSKLQGGRAKRTG